MVQGLAVILIFQLAGEAISRALGLTLPGPVLGMIGLVVAFQIVPQLAELVRSTAQVLLSHLSLLFVPAGVGVVAHLTVLSEQGPAIALAVAVSTLLAIAVGALAFVAVARVVGSDDG